MVHFFGMAYRATERTEARRLAARERIVARRARADRRRRLPRRVGRRRRGARRASPPAASTATSPPRPTCSSRSSAAPPSARSTPSRAALDRGGVAAGVETFARRALRGRRLAWALLAEPVDPAVEAERLAFRRAFRDAYAAALPAHVADRELIAAALVGAIGEALVGPLSPTAGGARDEDALVAALVALLPANASPPEEPVPC